MVTRAHAQLKGSRVRFLVRDVRHPETTSILLELHGGEALSGRVVDLSDDAPGRGPAFVVVEVERLRRPCIVPVDRLLPAKHPKKGR